MFFEKKIKKAGNGEVSEDYSYDVRLNRLRIVWKPVFKNQNHRFSRFVINLMRSNIFTKNITLLNISEINSEEIFYNNNLKHFLVEFKHIKKLNFRLSTQRPSFYAYVLLAVRERTLQKSSLSHVWVGSIYDGDVFIVYLCSLISEYVDNTVAYLTSSMMRNFAAPFLFRTCEKHGHNFAVGGSLVRYKHENKKYYMSLVGNKLRQYIFS